MSEHFLNKKIKGQEVELMKDKALLACLPTVACRSFRSLEYNVFVCSLQLSFEVI